METFSTKNITKNDKYEKKTEQYFFHGVTSSNINEVSHIMNKENRPPDKERDKPPPPSQNPTNPQKSKTSVFIVGDSMIKKVDGYLLTSSLKHQYL